MKFMRFNLCFVAVAALLAGCGDVSTPWNGNEPTPVTAADLTAAAPDAGVKAFYGQRQWAPAWSRKTEETLKAAIDARAAHGLDQMALWPDLNGRSPAEREALLTGAALRYAGALANGAADPASLHEVYTLKGLDTNVAAGLQQALTDGKLADWLNGLAPQTAEYKALSQAYLDQRKEAQGAQTTDIASGDSLKPGDDDPRVPAIRAALAGNGYLPSASDTGNTYTPEIVTAVEALQTDFGVTADGVIGPDTLAVLNTGPQERARALAVSMERMRWLTRTPAADRIDVNTAAGELRYFREGKVADRRKVITGKPGNETPQLESPIYRLVANPTWTIPRSIEQKEMASRDEEYFRRNNISRNEDGWLVQESGPENSLGLVKFDMRNEHAIYLHDTNSKQLFERQQRQLSHGCVRVHDALGFAGMIAAGEGVEEEWAKARESGKQSFVALPREIPARLIYQTVQVGDGGEIQYRTDPYGWDDAVETALGFTPVARNRFRTDVEDTGP
jgi:murein L,D-transpeptidase YcbB/YkuD